jgi:PAS domain S-box-containing protein
MNTTDKNEQGTHTNHNQPMEDNDRDRRYAAKRYYEITGQKNGQPKFPKRSTSEYIDGIIKFYDDMLACMPGNVYWWDKYNKCLGVNHNTAEFIGVPRHQLVGKTYDDFARAAKNWPPEQAARYLKEDRKVIETGNPLKGVDDDVPMPHPDGSVFYYYTSRVPLHNENNEVIGVLGISIDITERKKLEKELEQAKKNAEAYLQNAVEQIPGDISWKNKEGVYLGCNVRFAQRIGLASPEQVIGKTDSDLALGKLSKEEKLCNKKVLERGSEEEIEETKQQLDGMMRIFLTKKSPLRNENNEILGVIAISFDITDRKKAEEKRIEAMKSLGLIVAHEMRTPLAAIGLASSALMKHYPTLIQAYEMIKENNVGVPLIRRKEIIGLQSALEDIQLEVRSTNMIIELIVMNMDASKIANPVLEPCSMINCMREILARYPFKLEEREKVHWQNDSTKDFLFLGQKNLFAHILFNLIKNALYFIHAKEGGEIWIELRSDVEFNTLHFKDTGAGIPADILPSIFDRFFSRRYHGTGLGLAFCKAVMLSFGGRIQCYSQEGEYTEFVLSFPIIKERLIKK